MHTTLCFCAIRASALSYHYQCQLQPGDHGWFPHDKCGRFFGHLCGNHPQGSKEEGGQRKEEVGAKLKEEEKQEDSCKDLQGTSIA